MTARSDDGDASADDDASADAASGDAEPREEAGEPTTVTTRAPGDDVVHPAAAEREFGWRGYVLLVVMGVAFVVAPLVVYLRPPPLPWWISLVLFPLLPALLLGAVAVWATTRP